MRSWSTATIEVILGPSLLHLKVNPLVPPKTRLWMYNMMMFLIVTYGWQWPYHVAYSGSRPITVVKQHRAAWEHRGPRGATAWEHRVRYAFAIWDKKGAAIHCKESPLRRGNTWLDSVSLAHWHRYCCRCNRLYCDSEMKLPFKQ